ncbi:MAG: hypothetical protein LBI79_06070 [Nitrososphaerota archaeon]|nr:hypothetical protein [Nitrososphaerota archaeon]
MAQGEIEVNLTVSALLDKYGRPAVNEDDTFYPCDRFEITYSTKLARDIEFEGLDISYDRAIFNLFDNTDLVSQIGACSFEIMSLASAGTYTIHVTAYGSRTAGNETVTYAATATVTIQIVAYDPHFTLTLAYTIPSTDSSSCRSSFEQPFALILRYEGNGPDGNLRQRAVIDDYDWEGYAQKIPELDNMQQTLTPNLTVSSFLNQTSNTQFLRQGVDAKISQPALMVDGKSFANDELPLSFFWETNTNHTYTWTQALPVSEAEWFEWQASIVFPPQINPNTQQGNQSVSQEDLQNQLIEQINALNGNLTTTPFGNTVTAIYAHNKNIASLAKETSVDKNQTLNCLTDEPLYFTEQNRYAKLQYQLNPTVTKEITTQNFTSNLHYNLTVGCDLFGVPRYFEANFTCEYEFFSKQINATAYKWSPTLQNWTIDNTVAIDATFESALNITTTDILRSTLEEQTTDPTALQMATEDLYDSGIQRVTGTGSIETYLKRTSPLYYNLNVQAGNQQKVTLQKTIQINFQNNNTYNLPLNFNPNSPLQITTLSDSPQNTILNIDAPTELGGLTNITVYQITNLPNENWNTLQKNQLDLKWLKTLELTLPQEQVQMPPSHEQFYQYYQGYSAILEDILGFSGQTQIPIQKDQTTIALTSSSEALLYVEATNVWGTTFHQIITVQPYTTPSWNIPLNQATLYLITLITIAIIVSLITYYIKTIQK